MNIDKLKGSKAVIVPNFIAICPTIAQVWRFNRFPKWRPSAILDLEFRIFTVDRVETAKLRHPAKLGRSVEPLLNLCDLTIFQKSSIRHVVFLNTGICNCVYGSDGQYTMQNLVLVGQTIAETLRFFDLFFKMASVRHIGFAMCMFEPPTTTIWCYHCAKFGWNRLLSFNSMQMLILNEFGLKMPIHVPKWRFFLGVVVLYTINGQQSHSDPKSKVHICIAHYNQAYSEYKHVLANILRWLFVARTPSEEARSPCRRSSVENAPVTRQSAASSARRPRPAGRSHYVVISRDGRKLVTRVRVMLP